MKKFFTRELTIGVCVILALLILFFGIDYLKGINVFKAANYYYVSFTNVEGLAISSPVNTSGYKVGLVREMHYEYDNPGHVLVEISLDKELKVPAGTVAELTSDLLGTASIVLKMPQSTDYLAVGDRLEGRVASGLMDNVSTQLMPNINSILPKVDSLLVSVNSLAGDPALLASVQRLDRITANLETLTAQLARTSRPLPQVTDNAAALTGDLLEISNNLKSLTATLNSMPLDSTMTNVHEITASLNNITAKLESKDSSLGLMLNDAALYNSLNATVSSLDSLFIDIKKNPKRYISIKLL